MEYTVELSPRAFADVDGIVGRIQATSPNNATRWRQKLFQKMACLNRFPRGYSLAPEDAFCPLEIRQTFFGRYRILFTVRDDKSLIYVLTVRHGSRDFMTPDELQSIE